jgi:hypothetical protein
VVGEAHDELLKALSNREQQEPFRRGKTKTYCMWEGFINYPTELLVLVGEYMPLCKNTL